MNYQRAGLFIFIFLSIFPVISCLKAIPQALSHSDDRRSQESFDVISFYNIVDEYKVCQFGFPEKWITFYS